MRNRTFLALVGSISKWGEILTDHNQKDRGRYDCPLCHLFIKQDCKGCPVRAKTGEGFCRNSPYAKWYEHHQTCHGSFYDDRKTKCPVCTKFAKAEYRFLIGLLPKR